MPKLFLKIFIVLFFALLLSVGVNYFYLRAYKLPYNFPQGIFLLPRISNKYTLVKVGNSHAQDGLLFSGYKGVKTLDLSNVSQSFEFDLAMLKMNSQEIQKNAIIIINVSPISFSQDTPKKEDYVNMNYYDGRLSPFLIPRIKLSEYLQIQIFPFTRAGYLWRAAYAQEVQTKSLDVFAKNWEPSPPPSPSISPTLPPTPNPSDILVPSATPTLSLEDIHNSPPVFSVDEIHNILATPPDPSDIRLLESRNFMVNKWYNSGGFGTQAFAANENDLKNMIDYSLAHHWRPVLISLPISQILLQGLEPSYLQKYLYDPLRKVDTHHIDYFDFASDKRLTENRSLYSNSDHLNQKGASVISYLLLQKLISRGYLPKITDGYDYKPLRN